MNDDFSRPSDGLYTGFAFHGRWQEFLPIVLTNLLLTIVTLGVFRFWAKARERRYLWNRTQFVDDRLEWTGTGLEMFLGFLMVMAVLIPVGLFVEFGAAALAARGLEWVAAILLFAVYFGFFYLIGVAVFRALRYRLSRTRWHGLRGGSEDGGWSYGVSVLFASFISGITFGLAYPWAQVRLWRERWGAMSYGDARIGTGDGAMPRGLFRRWILMYVGAIGLMLALIAVFAGMAAFAGDGEFAGEGGAIIIAVGVVLGFYLGMPALFVFYYAKFMREMVNEMDWMNLDFRFTASTMGWIKLYVGHALLVIVTLGFGLLFIGYRNWSFFVRHLEVSGELDPAAIAQSDLKMRTDAEGLADAFDIGAI